MFSPCLHPRHPDASSGAASPEGASASSGAVPGMAEQEAELVDAFALFDDPMDRYAYLIDLGKALPAFAPERQTEDKLVPGCQSKVWLDIAPIVDSEVPGKGPRIRIEADSNTVITKGIVSILIRVLSGQHARDIVEADLAVLDRIDLRAHLSSQRANGLASMIQQIKDAARRRLPEA